MNIGSRWVAWGLALALSSFGSFSRQESRAVENASQTPAQVLATLDAASNSLVSFDVAAEVTIQFLVKTEWTGKRSDPIASQRKLLPGEAPTVRRTFTRQLFDRGKGRVEHRATPTGPATWCGVYDSETEKTWDPGRATFLLRSPSLELVPGGGQDYRTFFRTLMGRDEMVELFKRRSKIEVETEQDTICIRTPACDGQAVPLAPWGFCIRLDPSKGMMPAVVERNQVAQGKAIVTQRQTVTRWKSVGGIWVPTQVVSQAWTVTDKGAFGELYSETTFTVDEDKSKWNEPIAAESFELPIPAGTTVTDAFQSVQYVTGKPDPGKHLSDLAAHAENLIPVTIEGIPSPPHRSRPKWPWILATTIVVFVATAIVFIRRRSRT